ncbi:hypothetical protein [Lyngbya aestuarii]|uniref:hypothetical protein n=1 Tax=Lyngbya aestuarii TaxID=118322 RepID=UPI00403D8264
MQSGGEYASLKMIEARIRGDSNAKAMFEKAEQRLGDNPLKNALAAFYLRSASEDKEGAVEFAHKSFGEFLSAVRLQEALEEWTERHKRRGFLVDDERLAEEIYDLLGYGGLTPEIVEYLMALLDESKEFRPVTSSLPKSKIMERAS